MSKNMLTRLYFVDFAGALFQIVKVRRNRQYLEVDSQNLLRQDKKKFEKSEKRHLLKFKKCNLGFFQAKMISKQSDRALSCQTEAEIYPTCHVSPFSQYYSIKQQQILGEWWNVKIWINFCLHLTRQSSIALFGYKFGLKI